MTMTTSDTLRDTRIHLAHGSGAIPAVGFGTLIPDPVMVRKSIAAFCERTQERLRPITDLAGKRQFA